MTFDTWWLKHKREYQEEGLLQNLFIEQWLVSLMNSVAKFRVHLVG